MNPFQLCCPQVRKRYHGAIVSHGIDTLRRLEKIENDCRGGEETAAEERGVERSALDPAILGRHGVLDVDLPVGSQSFRGGPSRVPMAIIVTLVSLMNSLFWLMQSAPVRPQNRRDRHRGGSDFRDWALAVRHDAVARVVDPRSAAHLSGHVRLFCAEPLFGVRLVVSAVVAAVAAGEAADGQHGRRLGPAARG